MDLYRIAFRIIAGKAKRLAILFQPDKEVIILHTETEDWAVTTVTGRNTNAGEISNNRWRG